MNLALHNHCRFSCIAQTDAELAVRRPPAIALALACHNAFGGGASKSSTTSTQQQTAASEGSLAVGAGGKFQEGNNTSTKVNAGGDISVTTADPELLKTALDNYRDLSLSNTSAFSSFAKQLEENKAQDLATSLGAIGDLQQNTDEAAQNRKTFLYIVVALLIALVAIFIPWRKR